MIEVSWQVIGVVFTILTGLMTLVAWFMNYTVGITNTITAVRKEFDTKLDALNEKYSDKIARNEEAHRREFDILREGIAANKEWARQTFVDPSTITNLRSDLTELKGDVKTLKTELVAEIQRLFRSRPPT